VLALVDAQRQCHGFGPIRPCLLRQGSGWRIGPLLADSPELAERLLRGLGFAPISATLRMYRGTQSQVSLADVYGLACLELG
jgi:ribosomal-protein-alanine N-acetyltransferase